MVISTYSPLPNWDEWALFDQLAVHHGWSLGWLLAQHNEHRILFPKILFLLDVYLFHARQAFLLATLFLIQLLQVILLSFSLRRLGGLRGSAWRTGTGLIAYCIFCPIQQENLVWGFSSNFVLPPAMATLAILSLLLYSRRRRSLMLAMSIAAATVATWSLANGMLLWPLLLLLALLLRMQVGAVASLLASAALNISLYAYGYRRPSPTSGRLPPLHSLGQALHYVLAYFGSTWVRHSSGWIALVAGAAGVGAALLLVVLVLRRGKAAPLLLLQLAALLLFYLATAAVTSAGRLQGGAEQAAAGRYQTFALVFWCCIGLALLAYAATDRKWLNAVSAGLLVLMVGFATQVRLPLIDAQWHQVRLNLISAALITGVHDPAVLAQAYPAPNVVLRDAEYMRQQQLSIFAGSEYSQFGRPLTAVYPVTAPERCSGYLLSSQLVPSDMGEGRRLTGFAWDRERHAAVRSVVAASNGVISGLGTSITIPSASARAAPDADAARVGWLAFVRESAAPAALYALVGSDENSACLFASVPGS